MLIKKGHRLVHILVICLAISLLLSSVSFAIESKAAQYLSSRVTLI